MGIRAIFVLQSTPKSAVDKLLQLFKFFPVGLNQFFHESRKPGPAAALISEASNPSATVLHDNLVCFAIVCHHRRTAMEWILRVDVPLLGGEKMAHVCNCLRLGLNHEVLNCLHGTIVVSDGETRATPSLPLDRISSPARPEPTVRVDRQRSY